MLAGLRAVLYKELRQIRQDPATLVLALFIPVLQLTVFGYAINTEVRDVKTIVLDRSHSQLSRRFQEAFWSTGVFRFERAVSSQKELLGALRAGYGPVGLILPEDFDQRVLAGEVGQVQVLIDGSNNTIANQSLHSALSLATHLTSQLRSKHPEGHSGPQPTIEVRPRLLYNPDQRSERFFVPGLVAIILQLVTMVLTAFSIVRERERGTLEQLMVTPITRMALLLGKLLPFMLLGIVEACTVLFAMTAIFEVPIQGSLALLSLLTLLFLFCSLSLGLFISTIAQTQLQAMLASLMIMLPSVLLSGFMFPRESMPAAIYPLTLCIPATYFVEIMRGIVSRGADIHELARFVWPLAGLGLSLFGLGLLRFRKRLR